MIVTLLAITAILYLAIQFQDKFGLPSPLGLLILSFFFEMVTHRQFSLIGDEAHFAELVLLLLPILLISDSMELKLSDLREHGLSLFYLAVIAVALSVVSAIVTADLIFGEYNLSVAAVIVLFSMVLATDPVSVVSVFSRFELPHRLKILCEGESLFNDATALIVFVFIGLYAMGGGEVTTGYVATISLTVIAGSCFVGLVVGYAALLLLKTTRNRTAEMMVLILTGYGAFELSEKFYLVLNLLGGHSHLHLSGILSCIVAVITVQHTFSRAAASEASRIQEEEKKIERESESKKPSLRLISGAVRMIRMSVEENERHDRTKEDIKLLSLVANTILFVALAEIVDLSMMARYWSEIVAMFVVTTLIRALMMAKFAFITNRTTKMADVNLRWWGILTFAGIKGGLSIVMLMMIPEGFEHLAMFRAIVIGVILLSTFLYSAALLLLIGLNRTRFVQEKLEEGTR